MNILLTGANGYIGKHLARHLANAGHFVTAVTRLPDQYECLHHPNIKHIVTPHIAEESDMWTDVNVVVHAAGLAHKRGAKGENQTVLFRQNNVDYALAVARCAQKNGAARMIFLSSIGAALLEKSGMSLEQAWTKAPYRASKLTAEQELAAFARSVSNFDVVSVRLPMVYGKNAPGNYHTLCRALQNKIPLPFASIRNQRAFVAIQKVCDFVTLCLDHPDAMGVRSVRDNAEVSTPEFMRNIANDGGYPAPRLFPFPVGVLRFAGRLLGLSQTVESLLDSLHIDMDPLQKELDWMPEKSVKLTQGLSC